MAYLKIGLLNSLCLQDQKHGHGPAQGQRARLEVRTRRYVAGGLWFPCRVGPPVGFNVLSRIASAYGHDGAIREPDARSGPSAAIRARENRRF